jgi:hypothetical protein
MHTEFSTENLTEIDQLRCVVVDERAIFQQVWKKQFLRILTHYILVNEGVSFVNFVCN